MSFSITELLDVFCCFTKRIFKKQRFLVFALLLLGAFSKNMNAQVSCGFLEWTSCEGATLSSSNLESNKAYNTTGSSFRPCGIEVDDNCEIANSSRWQCINGELDRPTAFTCYTKTDYQGVGLTALQAARINWILCNYEFNVDGVTSAIWEITGAGGEANAIYNAAVAAVPVADGSEQNMVFYQSSEANVQNMVRYECISPCSFVANAGVDQSVCQGDAVTLTGSVDNGTGTFTYEWKELNGANNIVTIQAENGSIGGGAVISNTLANFNGTGYIAYGTNNGQFSEITVNVPTAGPYSFDVRYSYSGANTLPMELSINGTTATNNASFVSTPSTTSWEVQRFGPYNFSAGDNTVRFTTNNNAGVNIDEYIFDFTPSSFGQTLTVTPTTNTTYELTVSDGSGCTDMDEVMVLIDPTPMAMGDSYTMCCGEVTTGNLGVNDLFLSNPIFTIVQGASGNSSFTLNQDGSFTYTPACDMSDQITYRVCNEDDLNGCCAEATVDFIIRPQPIININVSDPEICIGESVTITASATGSTGTFTYEWDNGLGNGAIQTVSPTVTTTYRVTVTDTEGCSAEEEVTITLGDCRYDLALIKTLANGQSSSVQIGDLVNYTIFISNQGNTPSNDYTVMDQIPTGMSFVSASDGGIESNGIVTWNSLPNIEPNGIMTLTLVLRVDDATQNEYRNWAEITDDSAEDFGVTDEDSTPDGNFTNDPVINHNDPTIDDLPDDEDDNDFEDVTVAVEYDLALIKTLGTGQPATVNVGDLVSYLITVTNQGNVPSNDYSIIDEIPDGLSFISASDGGTASNGIVTWNNLPNLEPSESQTLALIVQVDDATQSEYRNWAEIFDDSSEDYGVGDEDSTPDSNVTNDPVINHNDPSIDDLPDDEDDNDFEDIMVNIEYDLALIKTLASGQSSSVTVGETVNYTITIINQGNVPSNDYTVTDAIPAGMSFVSASDFGSVNGSTVVWSNLPSLAPGASTQLSLALSLDDATIGQYINIAEITDDSSEDYGVTDEDSTPDNNLNNDQVLNHNDPSIDDLPNDEDDHDIEEIQLGVEYDLALIKTLATGQSSIVSQGETVRYEITIANQGNVPSLTYSVIDQIPAGMTFVTASNGGILNGTTVVWNNLPSLEAGEMTTLTLELEVTDITQGDFRNWAEISDDSSNDYGVTDDDSTPDANTGNDNGPGLGQAPNDMVSDHNNIALDNPVNDEDDNDFEDVQAQINYDLALIKTLGQGQSSTVSLGDIVVFNILVTNQGNVPSGDFVVTDQLPTGLSLVTVTDGGIENGGVITWNLPSLAVGETKTLNLIVRVDDATQSSYRNVAEISDDSSADYGVTDEDSTPDSDLTNDQADNHNDITLDDPPNDEDDHDFEEIQLNVNYDLALVKSLALGQPPMVELGEVVNFVITVANQGNVPSNDFSVTDQIPAGMEFVGASDFGAVSGNTVVWSNLPSLLPNETRSLTIALRVTDATQAPYENFAEISEDSAEDYGTTDEDSTPDSDPNNDPIVETDDITVDQIPGDEDDSDVEEVGISAVYDLALIKTLGNGQASSVQVGEVVDFDITIINQGNVPSNDYTVVDQIPTGMSFVSASNNGSQSGTTVTWSNLPSLEPGATQVLTISLMLDDPTQANYINIAEVTDDSSEDYGITDEDSTPDTNPNNDAVDNHNDPNIDDLPNDEDDHDIEEITLDIEYDLALIKTLSDGQSALVREGDQVAYTITIANQGNVPSNDYTVIDQIPAGMSFVSASNSGTLNGSLVVWSLSNIAPGEMTMLSLVLQVDDVTLGDYRNWAEISDDSSEDYGVTDEDSTPDTNTGNDNSTGLGQAPNDAVNDHNDINLDNPPNDEDDNDFEDVQVEVEYDLALIKVLAAGQTASVALGDVVNYEIVIANQGNVPSNDYSVVDEIPTGMTFIAASDFGSPNGSTVTWSNLPSLEPDETKILTISLRLDEATQSEYRNFAEISMDSSEDYNTTDEDSTPDADVTNDDVVNHNDIMQDQVPGDEDDNDFEPIQPTVSYDLALIKTLSSGQSASVAEGESVNYNIRITNQGNVPSNEYSVIDEIPAGMRFSFASDGGVLNGNQVSWTNLPSLAPGQFKILILTLIMEDVTLDTYRNIAEISDDSSEDYGVTDEDSTPDNDLTNDPVVNHNDPDADEVPGDEDDHDYEDISPSAIYDLALIKTLGNGQSVTVNLGETVDFEITVINQGNVPSNDYTVSDQIPAGMSFVSASDFGSFQNGTVTWTNLPSLNPNETQVLTITLRLDDATQGTYRNIAEITDDSSEDYGVTDEDSTPDNDPTNDPVVDHDDPNADDVPGDEDDHDYEDVSSSPIYDLALIKTLADGQSATLAVGETVRFEIIVINQGNVPSNDYTVSDQIPAGMSFVSASSSGTFQNGVVTWSNLSSLNPNETQILFITLRLDDATQGTYRNIAEITDDSSEDYGVTDEDSTPDSNPNNDPVVNHNDITVDEVPGDEDDHDYEDISPSVIYDLALIKTLADGQSATVGIGEMVNFEITVINQGNVPSNDYTVSDQIPAGMSFVSASDFGAFQNGMVTWSNLPSLNPNETQVLTITLRLDDVTQATYQNIAEIIDDSSADYGVTDEDSTPDNDLTNDPIINHNDPNLDNVTGDEDDHDIEEISPLSTSIDIVCASDITISCEESTDISVTGEITANSTCNGELMIDFMDDVSGLTGCAGTGIITRTWTVSDNCNNVRTCEQTITIIDDIAPVITCPGDLTINCNDSTNPNNTGEATTAPDNCPNNQNITITFNDNFNSPNNCQEGIIIRTWMATDDCGNASTCEQLITVLDGAAPTMNCPADVTVECGQVPMAEQLTATDMCDDNVEVQFSEVRQPGNCVNNYSLIRTWEATDDCGYSATCTQRVTVIDDVAPTIACPNDLTINCDQTTEPGGTGGLATASDNCSAEVNISITYEDQGSDEALNCELGGAFVRNYRAVDECGNESTCQQVIAVVPVTEPQECQDFVINASEDIQICSGTTAQLSVAGGVSYTWVPSIGLDDPFSANPAASPPVTTTYRVTGIDENGCQATDEVVVTVTNGPNISILGTTEICEGESTQLTATGGVFYNWSPSTGLSDATVASPIASPANTTTYTVTVTDNEGCTNTESVEIVVSSCGEFDLALQKVLATGQSQTVQLGETVRYTITIYNQGTQDGVNIRIIDYIPTGMQLMDNDWNSDGTIVIPFIAAGSSTSVDIDLLLSSDFTGTAIRNFAEISEDNGDDIDSTPDDLPSNTAGEDMGLAEANDDVIDNSNGDEDDHDSAIIFINNSSNNCDNFTIIDYPDRTICQNNTTQLEAAGGVSYAWSPTTGLDNPTIPNPIASPNSTTAYIVTVTNGEGCTATDEIVVAVLPGISVSAGDDQVYRQNCPGEQEVGAQLNATGGVFYTWSPTTGLNNPAIPNPIATPSSTTVYSVTVTDAAGCTGTDQVSVGVLPAEDCQEEDTDGDGLSNEEESQIGTDPRDPCSNNYTPGELCDFILNNPNSPLASEDCDDDGTINSVECSQGTNPLQPEDGTLPNNCEDYVIYECPDKVICVGGTAQLVVNGGVSWVWSPATGLDDPFSPIPQASPPTTTVYTVTGTDANGCTASEEVVVTVIDELKAFAGEDRTICDGESVQLNGQGGVFFQWSPATGLSDPTIANPTASPLSTTTYTVTVTNPMGCTGTAQVTITVGGDTQVDAGPDQALCLNETAQLNATGGVSYEWRPATNLSNAFIANPQASPTTTTTYTVIATDANGCTSEDNVLITINNPATANAGLDVTICSGESTTLNASGGVSYTWSPTTGLSNSLIANPVASPDVTTTYTVVTTDANGCTDTDEVIVTVSSPQAEINPENVVICSGETTMLTASGGVSYTWSPITGLSDPFVANPQVSPDVTTTYTVEVTDANGCMDTEEVIVVVSDPPADTGPDVTICNGESTTLSAVGGLGFAWSPTTGLSNPSIANPVASPTVTTTYTVTVMDGIGGCTNTAEVTVTVSDPQANAGPDATVCNGESTTLNASGGVNYTWSPTTGLSDPLIANPVASPTVTTTYTVEITDANGCTDTDNVTVTVDNFSVEACEDKAICLGDSIRLLVSQGVSYQWSPASSLDDPTHPSPNASPTETTTYTVTVTNSNGCTDTDEVIIYVQSNTTASAGEDIAECPGVGAQLMATGGMNYEWSPTTGLSDPSSATPFANPATTTTYTVTVMDFNGCTATDQVVYEVLANCTPPPCTEDIVDIEEVCADEDGIARICLPFTIEELNANYELTTSTGTIVPNHGCDFIPLFAYTYAILPNMGSSGTYHIQYWVVNGDSLSGTVANMQELATWMQQQDPSGNWTNRANSFFIQGGNPATTYGDMYILHDETWIYTTLTPSQTGQAQGALVEVDLAGNTNDTLTITNIASGCIDRIPIVVCDAATRCTEHDIEASYEVSISDCQQLGELCIPIESTNLSDYEITVNGDRYTGTLEACFSSRTYAYTYFSIPEQGENGPYQISSWRVNSNQYNGSFMNLAELLTWMNDMDAGGQWELNTSSLSIVGGMEDNDYGKLEIVQVNTRASASLDISTKSSSSGTMMRLPEGGHQVQLQNIVDGCTEAFEVVVNCSEGLAPVAESDRLEATMDELMSFDIISNDRADAVTIEIIEAPQHGIAMVSTDRRVAYEAIDGYCNGEVADYFKYRICNDYGCDEAMVEVIVKCPTMRVKSGFSPNGDGINDYLTIEGLSYYPNNELIIFNRWGTQIFKQSGYDNQWEGLFNGTPLTDGTYFYLLKDGEGHTQSGYIQINR